MTTSNGRSALRIIFGVVVVLLLAGCSAGAGLPPEPGGPGFWAGLWHGLISPVTFIVSLFNSGVSIYEVHNGGHWYDFGFMIGVSVIFGGSGRGGAGAYRRRRRSDAAAA